MTPLNILHTVEFYSPRVGGAEIVVQKLSEKLAARGHKVTVATSKVPERNFTSLNGVSIREFDISGNQARGLSGPDQAAYQTFLSTFPAEIMLNYAAQQWATDLAFFSVTSGRINKVNILAPCGYSALQDSFTLAVPAYTTYFEAVIPTILPLYDAAVYHSKSYIDYEFAENLKIGNGTVIPNAVDEDEFSRPVEIDFRAKYNITTPYFLLSVGNFIENKGQEHLIECLRVINRTEMTLVLIGRDMGTLAGLREMAAGLNVKFLTDIPRADTVAAFKSADLFVFASLVEASPLVIIEAKASRLPFVSTECGNVREFKGGIVCLPDEMAIEILNLLVDAKRRAQLAEEGWNEWNEKLNWRAVVDQYEQLYLRLAKQKGLIGAS